jgi:hypothetical protein
VQKPGQILVTGSLKQENQTHSINYIAYISAHLTVTDENVKMYKGINNYSEIHNI